MPSSRPPRHWLLPLIIAVLSGALSWLTLGPNDDSPALAPGPGITTDEGINVNAGRYLWAAVKSYNIALFHPDSACEVFGGDWYASDYPPLGRLLLGVAAPPLTETTQVGKVETIGPARRASAVFFALTVFIVGWATSRWYGGVAGTIAAVSVLLMPRVFAHGHIASIETFVDFWYVATILSIGDRWLGATRPSNSRPQWGDVLLAGLLLGLTLLTKIQGILLPVGIGAWALWRWRLKGLPAVIVWGLAGVAVFFIGWPWLWLDPVEHVREYLGSTTERPTLYCWYLGQRFADVDVPWHYSFVMFAVTVPIGLHLLGLYGLGLYGLGLYGLGLCGTLATDDDELARWRTRLIAINVVWPLVFFALPGITVYDGARLFLMVGPLWAVLIGRGGSLLYRCLAGINASTDALLHQPRRRLAIATMALLMLTQSVGVWRLHPTQLSYYNLLVGGMRGADALGLERSYWGDSVTSPFLTDVAAQVPAGSTIDVAPVLHPVQLRTLQAESTALNERGIRLRAFDPAIHPDVQYVLVFRRLADPWPQLTEPVNLRLLAEVRQDGVQLAALYQWERGAR